MTFSCKTSALAGLCWRDRAGTWCRMMLASRAGAVVTSVSQADNVGSICSPNVSGWHRARDRLHSCVFFSVYLYSAFSTILSMHALGCPVRSGRHVVQRRRNFSCAPLQPVTIVVFRKTGVPDATEGLSRRQTRRVRPLGIVQPVHASANQPSSYTQHARALTVAVARGRGDRLYPHTRPGSGSTTGLRVSFNLSTR